MAAQDPGSTDKDLRIRDVKAYATSYPIPPGPKRHARHRPCGEARRRRGEGDDRRRLVGYGESHHGRAHTAIAQLVNTTLRQLSPRHEARPTWSAAGTGSIRASLPVHGMGAGCAMAMSGIDMALWDIRGKACGWPLYKLLGGAQKPIPAYAGGRLARLPGAVRAGRRGAPHLDAGYKAVKLRVGDSPARDLARIAAVRKAVGDDIDILVDANTAYTVKDARAVMPGMDDYKVGWLEEPFPPHDYRELRTCDELRPGTARLGRRTTLRASSSTG
jgi:L-alanine-DL-glutamate epimerase-like enolase superfamily enzyme